MEEGEQEVDMLISNYVYEKHINIVHVKSVLRQCDLGQLQHVRPINDRMHQNVLIQPETAYIIPAEHFVLGQHVPVMNAFLMLRADFLRIFWL